jgi:Zn-dependent alcohol dehydrogenase
MDSVLHDLEQAETDEERLAIEAAALRATDNSARDGDHPDQLDCSL